MREGKIKDHMSPMPHSINSGIGLKAAKELMRKHKIRHLPVKFSGQLVGVLTDRDLKLGISFDTEGNLLVRDVMTPDPFTVSPTTSLREVVREMAKKKYGCAIVEEKKAGVVGIFTTTDALALMGRQLKKGAR